MADLSQPTTIGGQYGSAVTNAVTTDIAVYTTGGGRLCKITIITAGTASLSIYDGTQSTGGALMFTSLTNDALGVVKDLGLPFASGIVVKGTTGSPGVFLTYNKTSAYGN